MALAAIALTLSCYFPGVAQGGIIARYTDRGAFEAAIGTPVLLEDYESYTGGTGVANGGTLGTLTYNFTGTAAANGGFIDDAVYNPYSGFNLFAQGGSNAPLPFEPGTEITFSFATPVTAAGVYVNAFDLGITNPGDYYLDLAGERAFNGDNPVSSLVFGGSPILYFIGVVSDTPFTSITLGSLASSNSGGFEFDDVILGNAQLVDPAVPAPATGLIFGGLVVVAGLVRRRRLARSC